MNWGNPEVFSLLWGLPVGVAFLVLSLRSRRQALARMGAMAAARISQRALGIHWVRGVCLLGALICGVIALAQPQHGFRWQEYPLEGRDLMVVLDVSQSMDAEDVEPSRMERARREILDLIGFLEGDRVGLVLFAGGPYARMPLTEDYTTLASLTRDSSPQTLRAQGSDIGAALDLAAEQLLQAGDGAASQAIVLISDGEDQLGEAAAAATRAADAGIHIYAIGVGTPDGAPIPLLEGGFKKQDGQVVLSRLNEETLASIAQAGAGAYVRSVAGAADVRGIYVDEIRGVLQGAEQGVHREKIWNERYQWPLAVALLLVLISGLLRPGSLRLLPVLLVFLIGFASNPVAAAELDELLVRQVERPDDLAFAEEVGAALFAAGRFDDAATVLGTVADRSPDAIQRQRARTNAGLAAYRNGRLTQALEDWQRVLQDNPEHPQAVQNAQSVQQEIAQRLGEEPPPQDGDGEGEPGQDGQQGDPSESNGSENEDAAQDQDASEDGSSLPDDGGEIGSPETEAESNAVAGEDTGSSTEGEIGSEETMADGEEEQSASASGSETVEEEDAGNVSAGPVDMSSLEAERLLDSVEEGDPRVVVDPRSRGGNDW